MPRSDIQNRFKAAHEVFLGAGDAFDRWQAARKSGDVEAEFAALADHDAAQAMHKAITSGAKVGRA